MKLNQNKFLYGEMEDKKLKPFLLVMGGEWVEQLQTTKKLLSFTEGLQAKSREVSMCKFCGRQRGGVVCGYCGWTPGSVIYDLRGDND